MKIVFLAAGKGSRIYSKIKVNKSLIRIKKKTIISRLIENIPNRNINKIIIVLGFNYKKIINEVKKYKLSYIINKDYKKTEMLHSMYLALKKYDDDMIFSYTDIIYNKSIIKKILKEKPRNICLPIYTNWKKIWNIRKKKILEDAETLKIKGNKLIEIGRKITKIKEVQGQFMGIFFIPKSKRKFIINIIENNSLKKKQITFFMNYLLKKKIIINIFKYKKDWYEFDDYRDLLEYNKMNKNV